jgi:hypothetical protein
MEGCKEGSTDVAKAASTRQAPARGFEDVLTLIQEHNLIGLKQMLPELEDVQMAEVDSCGKCCLSGPGIAPQFVCIHVLLQRAPTSFATKKHNLSRRFHISCSCRPIPSALGSHPRN